MRNIGVLLLFTTLLSCNTHESSPIIGSWQLCLRDGLYKEFNISEHYMTTSVSNYQGLDYDDGITYFKSHVEGNVLVVTESINASLMRKPDTVRFEIISHEKIVMKNRYGDSELTRLKIEIPYIDSTNLQKWSSQYLSGFLSRAEGTECVDIRTDDEKYIPDLGEIEDDFDPIEINDSLFQEVQEDSADEN